MRAVSLSFWAVYKWNPNGEKWERWNGSYFTDAESAEAQAREWRGELERIYREFKRPGPVPEVMVRAHTAEEIFDAEAA